MRHGVTRRAAAFASLRPLAAGTTVRGPVHAPPHCTGTCTSDRTRHHLDRFDYPGSLPNIMKDLVASMPSLILLTLFLVLGGCSPVAPRNPAGFSGTWRLVLAKSDTPPVTKSQVLTIRTDGVHVSMTETLVNARDELLTISVHGRFDGVDYPVHGTEFADTVAYTLPAPNRIEGIARKGGVIVVKETAVLSDDGNSVLVTYVSFAPDGRQSTSRGLFERVADQ